MKAKVEHFGPVLIRDRCRGQPASYLATRAVSAEKSVRYPGAIPRLVHVSALSIFVSHLQRLMTDLGDTYHKASLAKHHDRQVANDDS